jgi:uncharacterized membrane protein
MLESNVRSIIKSICWRITGSSATFFIALLMTGDLTTSSVIGIIQIISNTILYYIHERIWNKIHWGRL